MSQSFQMCHAVPVLSQILRHAHDDPDRIALAGEAGDLSYAGLARTAIALCARLGTVPKRLPALPGPAADRIVGLVLKNGPAFLPAFLAATAPGHCALVIPPGLGDTACAEIVDAVRPDVFLCDADRLLAFAGAAPVFHADRLATSPERATNPLPDPEQWAGADEAAFLIGLTSGTTSTPKAFWRSRHTWLASLALYEDVFGLTRQDSVLAPGPLAHGLALYAAIECLFAGATFHMVGKPTPDVLLHRISEATVTRLVLVPTMLDDLVTRAEGKRFQNVRAVVTAGAKRHVDLAERARAVFPNARLIEYYGASELSFVTLSTDDIAGSPTSVGRAFPGVTVSIRSAEGRDPVPDGEIGTLYVDSPYVCAGLLCGVSEGGFRRTGHWASVGDRAWRDADGTIHLAGRDGDAINSGGNTFYAGEIEAALTTLDGIDEACVLGLPDARLGECAVAIVSGKGAVLADPRAACAGRLPRYKVPKRFFRVASLPRTANGKTDRKAVRALLENAVPILEEV
ncbi:MAG: AMP-binding protein [Pseudomonadota bacterium]